MNRSVRRRGRYGAAEKGAEIRGRWGWRCRGKGGGAAPNRRKSRGIATGICLRSAKARRTGGTVRRMFRQSADWGMSMPSEGRARGVLGRNAPRRSSCLPCCCRRGQRATFRGIFGLGDMTPRLSFSPGGGLCGRTSASARGRFAPRGKCAERAETRRTRSAAPRKALLRRRDGEFGGEVAPEHACRGQRIGTLRKSAAARGRGAAGRVSPEGGRPAED